jgi:hypothetical protein
MFSSCLESRASTVVESCVPPEIRNCDLKELFLYQDSIRLDVRWENCYGTSTQGSISNHLIHSVEFDRPVINVAFLATCRQLSIEAAGVLYSQNTFLVPPQTFLLFEWMENIGSDRIHLSSINIDVSPSLIHDLDLKLMMRELWRSSVHRIKFTYVKQVPGWDPMIMLPDPGMNKMLLALTPEVSPEIQCLGHSRQTVICVEMISHPYSAVRFKLQNTRRSNSSQPYLNVQYKLSSTGRLCRKELPRYIGRRILGLSLTDLLDIPRVAQGVSKHLQLLRKPVTFDLTSKTISQAWPAVL